MRGRVAKFPVEDGKKRCARCLEVKDVSLFPKKERGNSYKADCRACTVQRTLLCRARNLEKYKQKQQDYQRRVKRAALEAYGGVKCACCGEAEFLFLTIDHVNNDGATHRREIGSAGSSFYRWLKNNGYPPGFQVLCYNCNCGRNANNGTCPHHLEGATTIPKGSTQ